MAYYHCLLFDLDGTLLDFGAAEDAAIHETLAYYGFAQPQEAVDAYKQINSALWAALERGEVRQEKLVVQRFEKLLRPEETKPHTPANESTLTKEMLLRCGF